MNKLTISEKNVSPRQLEDEHFKEIEELAGLGYSPSEIALALGIDEREFILEAERSDSLVNYHLRRGVILSSIEESRAMLQDAKSGNTFASERLAEIKRSRGFESTKMDIFGGFDDINVFEKIADYINSGCSTTLGEKERLYFDLLLMFYNLDRKLGRRKTIAYFVKEHGFTHQKASDVHAEALNLFYSDRNVEKRALRNKEAETLLEMSDVARQTAKTPRDLECAAKIREKAHKLMELNKPEPTILPKSMYLRPLRVFVLDVEVLGLPSASRNELASQIDSLKIAEVDKLALRRDAMIEDIDFIELIDHVQTED